METEVARQKRLRSAVFLTFASLVISVIFSCATVYHGLVMKGSIVEASDSEVYLCIGSKDGASVGQELDVYKIIRVMQTRTAFRRELVGKIKITEIVDEHFAKATVISGKAEKDDIVELTGR